MAGLLRIALIAGLWPAISGCSIYRDCEPGEEAGCTCAGGGFGFQVCREDGSGFGDCECSCQPGQRLDCTCPEGGKGFRICPGDGDGWSECLCDFQIIGDVINPCRQDLISAEGCALFRVTLSSLEPLDPYHCSGRPGPLARACEGDLASCGLPGSDFAAPGRLFEVACMPAIDAPPTIRSLPVLFDRFDPSTWPSLYSMFGLIDGFVPATLFGPGPGRGACSELAEPGGRYGHAAVTLEDGRVLVTGGIRRLGPGVEEFLATAEIFDPRTGEHRLLIDAQGQPVKMNASNGRAFHSMTRLRGGKLLIAGGVGPVQDGQTVVRTALRSAELFDPELEAFTFPMDMGTGRAHHTATALATGGVLLAGGATYGADGAIDHYLSMAVVFDPATLAWTPTGNGMTTRRAFHQAVLLDPTTTQGKVLVIGGENQAGPLGSVDVFNPNNLEFWVEVDARMSRNRSRFCAARLPSGKVVVAGGTTVGDDPDTPELESAADDHVEIYDPAGGGASGAFLPDDLRLSTARLGATCTPLEDGRVLIAGGLGADGPASGAGDLVEEDGDIRITETVIQMSEPRWLHTAAALPGGFVLLSGGLAADDLAGDCLGSSELFTGRPVCR